MLRGMRLEDIRISPNLSTNEKGILTGIEYDQPQVLGVSENGVYTPRKEICE